MADENFAVGGGYGLWCNGMVSVSRKRSSKLALNNVDERFRIRWAFERPELGVFL